MSYICEKCRKEVTQKYGSGRFCSRKCANSRVWTDEINKRRSNSAKKSKPRADIVIKCVICGKEFTPSNGKRGYPNRYLKTCSKECLSKLKHMRSLGNKGGGFRKGSAKNYKHGYYNGIYCDSSWELCYVVYCNENNIKISRNKNYFEYLYEGKIHKYYPDFILEDGTYVEIKGYSNDIVKTKIDQLPKNIKYKILYYNDIKPMINYCINKYGKNYVDILYEKI